MTAAGRFRCCQCCRGGEDPEYHTEHGADSHEIPCPTCEVSPRLRAQVEHLTAGRDELAARLAAVEGALARHPVPCPVTASCGWKRAVEDARAALAAPTDTTKEQS